MRKSYFIIAETLIFASTNIEKMLTTFVITVIILLVCVLLMCVKILFVKGGKFPNTHIEGNRALGKKGIYCAKTMDRIAMRKKGLYELMQETKK